MSNFVPGQRVTASQLNSLQDAANEGLQSNTDITYGKIVNAPTSLQYKQLYSAPHFLDTRYGIANVHFDGEVDGVNQHLYICLVSPTEQLFRVQGEYWVQQKHNSAYMMLYDDLQGHIASRLVSYQDFDINTDLETRQMGTYLSSYVPYTNIPGYVETPIPPDRVVRMSQLMIYNSTQDKVGTIFLIWGSSSDEPYIMSGAIAKILSTIRESQIFGDDIKGVYEETQLLLIFNHNPGSRSKIQNIYQNLAGNYTVEYPEYDAWEVDRKNSNIIHNPYYQIGCRTGFCEAYEDSEYNIHVLSADEYLSAKLGTNYCVIDIPRLSAYHTYETKDHPLSSSPNYNEAYHVVIPVLTLSPEMTQTIGSLKTIHTQYLNRHPTAPCWQIYPF